MNKTLAANSSTAPDLASRTIFPVLFAIGFSHLLNDLMQAVIPAVYPILKSSYHLSFTQIGFITFTFQVTASLLQPFVGAFTDKRPLPFSLAVAMLFTLSGLVLLAYASAFPWILLAVSLAGIGSSIFHPEASRVAYLASGGNRGLAQSIFQLGGNAGSAIGPLLVALIVVPFGQYRITWFVAAAIVAIMVLLRIGGWYRRHLTWRASQLANLKEASTGLSRNRIKISLAILLTLIFSKYVYMASLTNYFTFYLIQKFGLSVQASQLQLFIFLISIAAGTVVGGPLGDKFGRKYIIWISILGAAPFTLLLPYANLFWTSILTVLIGFIISSAFSAILVYAQELVPGKVGMISGLFFGFAFGMAGLGSALLGILADKTSILFVFKVCAFLPLLGVITGFLPNLEKARKR